MPCCPAADALKEITCLIQISNTLDIGNWNFDNTSSRSAQEKERDNGKWKSGLILNQAKLLLKAGVNLCQQNIVSNPEFPLNFPLNTPDFRWGLLHEWGIYRVYHHMIHEINFRYQVEWFPHHSLTSVLQPVSK